MTRAFLFLLARSWKNRVRARLRRLRRPGYLVSVLAGFAYLLFVLFLYQPFSRTPPIPQSNPALDPGVQMLVEAGFATMLLAAVLFEWFFANTSAPLFSEAEVQFLFPAPVTRGALLNYRIANAQIGIWFGSMVSTAIFGAGRLFPNLVFPLIGIWLVYTFLYLFRVAALMTRHRMNRQAENGRRNENRVLALAVLAAIAGAVWGSRVYPAPPTPGGLTAEALFGWLKTIAGSGPLLYLLAPFRMLIRPAFAAGGGEFAARLVPLLAAIAAAYAWVHRAGAGFEESVLGPSRRGGNSRKPGRPRRIPFRLPPEGFAPAAIYWKNLSLLRVFRLRETLPAIACLAVFAVAVLGLSGELAPLMIGSIAAVLAPVMVLVGPVIFRNDLRTDLGNIDILKPLPIPGWGIVLGEVLSPATLIALLEWLLVLLAAALWPGFDRPWKISDRVCVALGAALLLPCLSLAGILVQNAAVLLLPGWMQLGPGHQRGVEAMGQRLIAGIATLVSVLIAAVPAGLLFMLIWAAGYRLIGVAVVPLASLAASVALIAESAAGILILGRLFDQFDPSRELS